MKTLSLPAHWNKQFSPMTLLSSSSLIWCWKPFSLIQFEDPFQQACLLIPPSFLWAVFASAFQVWLQDTSFIPRINGVAGLGAPEFQLVVVFCRTFLRLNACDLDLDIPRTWFFFLAFYLLPSVKADLLFPFESFNKQCSLTTTLTVPWSYWNLPS